jgi:NTP pyrophosphatase (non-canonical NTP hydrolase)
MERRKIWEEIELELRRAKKKFPSWPDHIVSRAAIVAEEAGELVQASLQYKYQRAPEELVQEVQRERMKEEAVQTAAMAIRFLENLENL